MENKTVNILIVDDDPNVRKSFCNILKLKGYNVEITGTGSEGIALAAANFYNLIFVDLNLPDISGIKVIKKISSINEEIIIIMMTAYASLESSIEAIKSGAFSYVIKPININEVLLQMEKALEKQRLSIENKRLVGELKEKNSNLAEASNKLEHLAMHDSLTGLPNRRYFEDYVPQIVAKSKRNEQKLALFVIDVDNFKWINDTFGHDVGDVTLKKISSKLRKNIRTEDIAARIGGDEFAIVLNGIDSYENAVFIAHKILNLFQKPFTLKSETVQVTISIGIAFYPLSADNVEILIKHADLALYKAKSKGKNCVEVYSEEVKKSYSRMSEIEHALQFAVDKKELSLFYQPIVNMATNKILGVEALLRWQNDNLGSVDPIEFIHVAEKKGFINKIGLWVFNEACEQASAWKRCGTGKLFLAVNISPVQLEQEDFTKQISNIIKKYNINPFQLEIELTESAIKNEVNFTSQKFLLFCKQVQLRLSIDDFGTGFSSLSRLAELPVSTLKIDGFFLKNMQKGSKNYNIVKSTIALAKSLSLQAIAECVENKEQADILLKLGCKLAQGFYYYKPMSAKDITPILKKNS